MRDTLTAQGLFNAWASRMPEWVKKAYNTNPGVNKVIRHCADEGTTMEEMQWRVAAILFHECEAWREIAMKLKANDTSSKFVIEKEDK